MKSDLLKEDIGNVELKGWYVWESLWWLVPGVSTGGVTRVQRVIPVMRDI